MSEFAQRAKAAWARLIRKVYESDPLECPKCKGPMRVIALIEDPIVVRAILLHLGRWQPKAVERAPPVPSGRLARAGERLRPLGVGAYFSIRISSPSAHARLTV